MERAELLARFADKIPVLNHGFLHLVDVMGDDGAIIEAARVSTGKGRTEHKWKTKGNAQTPETCAVCGVEAFYGMEPPSSYPRFCVEGDRRFIGFLMRSRHTTPFEQCEIKLHVKLPIFVARQWIRHRTWSFNELSGRYSEMPDETFRVKAESWRGQDTVNRQGSAGMVTTWPQPDGYLDGKRPPDDTPGKWLSIMQDQVQFMTRQDYQRRLAFGVSKELARVDLPLSTYTEWYCKTDLHNLLHFLGLRMDAHAQPEIQVYANAIAEIVKVWCPLTWAAFEKHRLNAQTLSGPAVAALRSILEKSGLSAELSPKRLAEHRDFAALDKADRETLLRLIDVEGKAP